ncbi:MAG: thiol-disulfide isomerase [Acidobacteria bacterium]|nr:thiol-disulfide isomerase [Acidobacteriota bacterium]
MGSFPLTTYAQARPWAAAIKAAVLSRKMPPWFADPRHGKFSNERVLSELETAALVRWADGGAKEGSKSDAPPAREFVDGWNIPKPDIVLTMSKPFAVPAEGSINYQYMRVPTGFTDDKWIQMAEVRPSARGVVHHVVVLIRKPDSHAALGGAEELASPGSVLTIYTPGMVPDVWKPGQAKRVPAGSDLIFQIHYTANGKATEDVTKIGLVFAKEQVHEQVLTVAPLNRKFRIPPGDANHPVSAEFRLPVTGKLVSLFPHMHLRGKDFSYKAVLPDGSERILLSVPRYDFNWQLSYKVAAQDSLPAGTRIICEAHFDNSINNRFNPDPKAEVRWGQQSWEEMMIGFADFAVPYNGRRE